MRSSRSASSSRNRASRFADGGVERAQTQVLTDALLMLGDRLLPALVGVDQVGLRAGGAEGLFREAGCSRHWRAGPPFWGGEPVPASACPSPPSRHRPAEDVDWERDDGGNRPAAKGQPLLELGPSNSNRAEEAP